MHLFQFYEFITFLKSSFSHAVYYNHCHKPALCISLDKYECMSYDYTYFALNANNITSIALWNTLLVISNESMITWIYFINILYV